MSDVKGMDDFATGQRKAPRDRDLRIAAELGAWAAKLEINQPGNPTLSDWVRDDFRKGILSRYRPSQDDGEWERAKLADQRRQLNDAYYCQSAITQMINAKPKVEVVEIDGHAEIVIPSQRTDELLTVMADGMRNQALVSA